MSYNEASQQTQNNTDVSSPRLRVNRTAGLNITTTAQRLDFNGTSPYNLNSYPIMEGETMPSVYYDASTKLFKFTTNYDKNYSLVLSVSITASVLLSTLNLTSAMLRAQLFIPSSPSTTFPLPDSGGYVDICPVNIVGQQNQQITIPFFSNNQIRENGFGVNIWLSASVLGTVTLNSSDCSVYRSI